MKFRENPFHYSKKMFEENKSEEPEFSKQEAEALFRKEYSDKNRGMEYNTFSGIPPAKNLQSHSATRSTTSRNLRGS